MCFSEGRGRNKVLPYKEYIAVSGIFRTIDPHPLSTQRVCSPPARKAGGGGVHTRRAVRGWGSIFRKTPDIGWPLTVKSLYGKGTPPSQPAYFAVRWWGWGDVGGGYEGGFWGLGEGGGGVGKRELHNLVILGKRNLEKRQDKKVWPIGGSNPWPSRY
jgi:hypothetical protein